MANRNKLAEREGFNLTSGKIMKVKNTKFIPEHKIQSLIDDAWLGVDIEEEQLYNPLEVVPRAFEDDPHIFLSWVMSRPEYISIFCKQIMNVTLFPMQALAIQEMWYHRFPLLIATRGYSKSFSLAIYGMLRALFMPGRKICICGSSFRQSKIIFEYMENVLKNAPLFRDLIGNDKRDDQLLVHDSSMWSFRIGQSRIICIPMGSGDTIRGLRANDIYADELSSINRNIFENVVAGFGVVSSTPMENIKREAAKKKRIELGVPEKIEMANLVEPNQIILSGTAYYRFNHFFDYFDKYRKIIRSCGDKHELRKVVGDEVDNPAFDWKDYCIIRIPYKLLPPGYLDASQVSRSRVSVTASNFLCEYGACFASDSDGFFKRSLIERCVPNDSNVIRVNNTIVDFIPKLEGNSQCRYVIAIDPASENDNCAIVVIELRDDHRRIVYCWTTNKKLHRKNLAVRRTEEDNYWAFVVRKIRDLMKKFPTAAIAIDSQGGGNSVMEGLHDKDKMEPNEVPIWEIYGSSKNEWVDKQEGLHMIHMINFASADWLRDAYFNTKKDMEEQLLLFPNFDGATMGMTECDDKFIEGGPDDNLEALVDEIEELKNELTCIIHSHTPSGRDQFTVPDIKTAEGKKAKVKKDRASALIMANSVARSIMRDYVDSSYESNGGFAAPLKEVKGSLYSNPWFSNGVKDAYDAY